MRVASVQDLPAQHREEAQRQIAAQRAPRSPEVAGIIQALTTEQKPKRTKYGNQRVTLEGETFDSRLEYDCWCWLRHRKSIGEIAYIKRQVVFVLEGDVRYRADFEAVLTPAFVRATGASSCAEVWDAKGFDTRQSINKRKQVLARYGVEVKLWTKANR